MVTFTGDDGRALISHSAHHHPLKLVATGGALFQCDGCRQIGDGLKYRCDQCDFDLHAICAHNQAVMEHPLFEGHALTFYESRPVNPTGCVVCNVCGDPVLGFLYHNTEHDHDFHPYCASLPMRIGKDGSQILNLTKDGGHSCGLCGMVGRRSLYFSYCLQDDDDDGKLVYFHVACVMELHHSSDGQVMQANSTATGEASPMGRTGRFRRICKVAFRVVRISYSVATLDPVGVITGIVSPI